MKSYKKELTKKWAELFPAYKIHKTSWLIKIKDCFAFGIYLKTSDGYGPPTYTPNFHIQNLGFQESESITFELNFPLKKDNSNVIDSISLDRDVALVAEKLKSQNPLIVMVDDIKDLIINCYKNKIVNYAKEGGTHPSILIESLFYVLNYYKYEKEYKQACLEWCEKIIDQSSLDFIWKGNFEKYEIFNRIYPLLDDSCYEKTVDTLSKNIASLDIGHK